ncbi:hypothetical protein ACFFIX_25130 [Metabacillus herbersteinensis]|uniref:Uncharacterized protein n=1 Tax=Metabacillus herbersteinensis TaxID=283816 RepID=A0ABV6GNC9_9BACI
MRLAYVYGIPDTKAELYGLRGKEEDESLGATYLKNILTSRKVDT